MTSAGEGFNEERNEPQSRKGRKGSRREDESDQLFLSSGLCGLCGSAVRSSSNAGHFFCANSHSITFGSAYVFVHESCSRSGYSVYFGSAPTFFSASIISRDRPTGTARSFAPWNAHTGTL